MSFCWIVALSFLGVGLLVGWLLGYHAAKRELSGKTFTGDDDN